eukprot:jgi/Botrbrau1/22917/Bobra.0906s0001.1
MMRQIVKFLAVGLAASATRTLTAQDTSELQNYPKKGLISGLRALITWEPIFLCREGLPTTTRRGTMLVSFRGR